MDKLLELLAYLPPAIKQAAAFMVENTMPVHHYMELFQSTEKKKVKLLSEDFEAEARYENVENAAMTTWLISFDHIFKKTAYDYKASQVKGGQKVEAELPNRVDDLQVEKSIGTLVAYSFNTKTTRAGSYDFYRLVSLSMRNWLQKENVSTMYATQVVMRLVVMIFLSALALVVESYQRGGM